MLEWGTLVLTPNGALLLKFADTVTTRHSVFTCLAADIKAELEYSALHVMEKLCPIEIQGNNNGIIVIANSISQVSLW